MDAPLTQRQWRFIWLLATRAGFRTPWQARRKFRPKTPWSEQWTRRDAREMIHWLQSQLDRPTN